MLAQQPGPYYSSGTLPSDQQSELILIFPASSAYFLNNVALLSFGIG